MKRLLAVGTALLIAVGVAAAPSFAQDGSVPSRGTLGFVPASNPVHVTSDSAHIMNLTWIAANSPIRLANGSMSASDTVYLRLQYLTLNNLVIAQNVNGRSLSLTNANGGDASTAARIGAAGTTTDAWAQVTSLDLCISAQTLTTLVNSYAASFGANLPNVLTQITDIFGPTGSAAGPCVPLARLLPLLSTIVQAGVPLPSDLPATNIDISLYALNVAAAPGVNSLSLPLAGIGVEND